MERNLSHLTPEEQKVVLALVGMLEDMKAIHDVIHENPLIPMPIRSKIMEKLASQADHLIVISTWISDPPAPLTPGIKQLLRELGKN